MSEQPVNKTEPEPTLGQVLAEVRRIARHLDIRTVGLIPGKLTDFGGILDVLVSMPEDQFQALQKTVRECRSGEEKRWGELIEYDGCFIGLLYENSEGEYLAFAELLAGCVPFIFGSREEAIRYMRSEWDRSLTNSPLDQELKDGLLEKIRRAIS